MAMNLRMEPELADALRALAEETGRSQQDLAREAIALFVREYRLRAYPPGVRHLITPATEPFDTDEPATVRLAMPEGMTSERLLREERDRR
jgi:hypothetical protein